MITRGTLDGLDGPDGRQERWRLSMSHRISSRVATGDRRSRWSGTDDRPVAAAVSGTWQLRLQALHAGSVVSESRLGPVEVTGEAWDEFVRIDRVDPRASAPVSSLVGRASSGRSALITLGQ